MMSPKVVKTITYTPLLCSLIVTRYPLTQCQLCIVYGLSVIQEVNTNHTTRGGNIDTQVSWINADNSSV